MTLQIWRNQYLTLGLVLTLALLFVLLSTKVLAVSPDASVADPVAVRGNVYNVLPPGTLHPLSGVSVTVSCPVHNKKHTQTVTTDGGGLYTVDFTNGKCDPGSLVRATASFNGQTTIEKVQVSGQNTATLNFYF